MKLYRSYKFKDYDPIIDKIEEVLYVDGMTKAEIARLSGVSTTTLYNWQRKKTRSPKASTVNATLHVMGYELTIQKVRNRGK